MLTDTKVRSARPRQKPYKIFDERGLFLLVYPNGRRGWRFRYRYRNREKLLSLGSYPDTSLKLARSKRDEARRQLAAGEDPSAVRKAEKAAREYTFQRLADEWLKRQKKLSTSTVRQLRQRLDSHVIPYLGRYPVAEITAPQLLVMLRKIEARGAYETAHRVRSLCSRVFRFAIADGKAERDPASDLKGALVAFNTQHFAAVTDPKRIGELLRAIDGYQGQPAVMAALKVAPLVFVRPGELRGAQWTEFDLDAAEWRISGDRMKMGNEHVVPLSDQVLEILEELEKLTGRGRLLFPSLRSVERPISNNTLNAALRRLGFAKDEMTAHGFRTTASTCLHELGFPSDVIELQLAHADRNKIRASYNRATRLAERTQMMQAWADYLDGLKADTTAKVRALRG